MLPLNKRISLERSEESENNTLKIYCGVEQLVARRAHNPEVAGSSPVPATTEAISTEVALLFIKSHVHSLHFIFKELP